jgi:uncharacterized SAM-binding protein YcdF (DUF218 family)
MALIVVVVFGAAVRADGSPSGTLERRVRSAWLFGRCCPNTKYLVSGGAGRSGYPEWQVMRGLLLQFGVPGDCIVAETLGTDTLTQVQYCTQILKALPMQGYEVYVATSRYHQARCRALFAVFGIKTHIVASLPDRFDLPLRRILWFWMRELFAFPYDLILAVISRL